MSLMAMEADPGEQYITYLEHRLEIALDALKSLTFCPYCYIKMPGIKHKRGCKLALALEERDDL